MGVLVVYNQHHRNMPDWTWVCEVALMPHLRHPENNHENNEYRQIARLCFVGGGGGPEAERMRFLSLVQEEERIRLVHRERLEYMRQQDQYRPVQGAINIKRFLLHSLYEAVGDDLRSLNGCNWNHCDARLPSEQLALSKNQ